MEDIFQHFFRYSRQYRSPSVDWDPEEPNSHPLFKESGLFSEPEELFQHWDQHFSALFESLGTLDFDVPTFVPELPPLPDNRSLRDNMLKLPDSVPESRIDSSRAPWHWFKGFFQQIPDASDSSQNHPLVDEDLDSTVSSNGLSAILKKPQQFVEPRLPNTGSTTFSSSSTTFRGTNGKIEEKVTRRDHLGNELTTIRRRLGDQEYSVTTKRDKHGEEDREETFVNIDEKNLNDFENAWATDSTGTPARKDVIKPYSFTDLEMFERLFKRSIHPPK